MDQTTGASVGATPVRSARGLEARRTFTETKNGFKTSEFLMMLVFVVAVLVAAYADGEDSLGHADGWLFAAVVAAGYIVSRGLAKLGTREPYTADEEQKLLRVGRAEIRPLGGGFGCLMMILFSVVASVILTLVLNLLLQRRWHRRRGKWNARRGPRGR